MEYEMALKTIDLNEPFTINELRKAYHKKCLQYHPDKNKFGETKFKLCAEAYETLTLHYNKKHNIFNMNNECNEVLSYEEILINYISSFSPDNKWTKDDLSKVLYKIIQQCQNVSLKLFDSLDNYKMIEVYEYIVRYNSLFHIEPSILQQMKEIVKQKTEHLNIIILEPSITDLLMHKVYKLIYNDNTYYIPLWHNELYFKDDIIIRVLPDIPSNIIIDDNNNIIATYEFNISDIIQMQTLDITIGTIPFNIPVKNLYIRSFQEYKITNNGIAKINTKEIFNNKNKADVIFRITLQ